MSTCQPTYTQLNNSITSMVCAEMQGIGSILRPDVAKTANAASLRRALSADTSAKMQKFAFETSSTPPRPGAGGSQVHGAAGPEPLTPGPSNKDEEEKPAGRLDIWSSIMFQKANDEDEEGSAPYVHPLVKRSKSALSQISLQICTENLGSENGSDEFSHPLSPPPEGAELCANKEQFGQPPRLRRSEEEVARPVTNKRPPPPPQPRNFPPPLRSYTPQLQSHRDNGRLVVEALRQAKHFRAERRGGRLLLSLVSDWGNDVAQEEMTAATEMTEKAAAPEPRVPKQSSAISLTTQLMVPRNSMSHLVGMTQSKTPPWPTKCNEVVINFPEDAGAAPKLLPAVGPRLARLIPTPPISSPYNDYEYCWRRNKPREAAAVLSSLAQPPPPKSMNSKPNKVIVAAPTARQSPVLMWSDSANEAECWVPLLWGLQGTQNIYLDLGGMRYRNQHRELMMIYSSS